MSHGRALGRVGPLKMKTSSFSPKLHWEGTSQASCMGPMKSGIGRLGPKIGPCTPGLSSPKFVNCSLLLILDSALLDSLDRKWTS